MQPSDQPVAGMASRGSAHRTGRWFLLRAIWLGSLLAVGAGILTARWGGATDPVQALIQGFGVVSAVTVGAIIATRLPGKAIGWLFCLAGLAGALTLGATDLADFGLVAHPGSVPGAIWLAWLSNWLWAPYLITIAWLVPLLFPTGTLPSPRWRIVVIIGIASIAAVSLETAVSPLSGGQFPAWVQSPLVLGGPAAGVLNAVSLAATIAGVATLPLVAWSVVQRYRHGNPIERQQLKWFLALVGCVAPALLVALILSSPPSGLLAAISNVAWFIVIVGLTLLPLTIGIAMLRYRLYDIDVLLNRTAVYGTVSVVLAAGFVVANLALQAVLQALTHQRSELMTEGLALGVGLLFEPMRRRIRPLVDRFLPARAELALLFTDIVGSTERIVEIGDDRWRALLGQYLAGVRAELARYRGREINTAGDAFFATFQRPLDAVEAAWAIRRTVSELGLETRTGLHLGEVEMRGEQVTGLAVHTAARVMAAAADGEILVSDALREAVDGRGVATADRGHHALKGVPGDWQLYAIEPQGASTA
jgi:class 3 adenylate cyclase